MLSVISPVAQSFLSQVPHSPQNLTIITSNAGSTYYICAFIARLLLGQYTDPGLDSMFCCANCRLPKPC